MAHYKDCEYCGVSLTTQGYSTHRQACSRRRHPGSLGWFMPRGTIEWLAFLLLTIHLWSHRAWLASGLGWIDESLLSQIPFHWSLRKPIVSDEALLKLSALLNCGSSTKYLEDLGKADD